MSDKTTLLFLFLFAFVCYIHLIEYKLWGDVVELILYALFALIIAASLIYDVAATKGLEIILWVVLIAGCWAVYITAYTIKYRMIKKSYR